MWRRRRKRRGGRGREGGRGGGGGGVVGGVEKEGPGEEVEEAKVECKGLVRRMGWGRHRRRALGRSEEDEEEEDVGKGVRRGRRKSAR